MQERQPANVTVTTAELQRYGVGLFKNIHRMKVPVPLNEEPIQLSAKQQQYLLPRYSTRLVRWKGRLVCIAAVRAAAQRHAGGSR